MTLQTLQICIGLSEPSLSDIVISTKLACALTVAFSCICVLLAKQRKSRPPDKSM